MISDEGLEPNFNILMEDCLNKCWVKLVKKICIIFLMCEWLKWIFVSENFLFLNPFKSIHIPRRQFRDCSQAPVTHFKEQYSVRPVDSA